MKSLMSGLLICLAVAQVQAADSKYIVIQNVATERTRVYERCTASPGCAHRMIYETEMVVGKNDDDTKTLLGVFRINKWVKFYEDGNRAYPSWYDPNYPQLPGPNSSGAAWMKDKYMPNGDGEVRGAFGWYAATLEPNAFGQWMHGTIGWGADGDKFIRKAHKAGFLSLFVDFRSHGCTRHENGAIAYLQALLPAQTPVIRIYALEDAADPSLSRYEGQRNPIRFDYLLTKESTAYTIAASNVMARLEKGMIRQDDVLEQGTYMANQYPNVFRFLKHKASKSGKSGDSYKVGEKGQFRGVFHVDTGYLAGYVHPQGLKVGGDQSLLSLPSFVKQ